MNNHNLDVLGVIYVVWCVAWISLPLSLIMVPLRFKRRGDRVFWLMLIWLTAIFILGFIHFLNLFFVA